ncbi:hypothetical protein BDK89_3028 [Ilumatobacter fluminis]|uniref:Membrane protein 6-pyruvoyl-tetrahydropterin synthase-related domain-containing protein n=1 Tax=Ilumatobacter fluminis TaxID=467091 RepID=A0A4R7I2H6_9ACTN|nr:hypothetical protein [Ilumatobacter fluminis]TDT17420.1 hypothetical protein BDK89_3028 [Ilumatobacter fluminis]
MTDRLDPPTDAPDEASTVDETTIPVDEPIDEGPVGDTETEPSLLHRAGARIVRRPVAWWRRPWTDERIVRVSFTTLTLLVTTYIMTNVVHLSILPGRDLVFDDTTPTGGDFGAHVWGPAYLRDHLLGGFRLNGWTMDWYAGFPAYRFYMVLPALAVVLVDLVLPYGVALKLVSVLGLITLPFSCWAFGRLASFKYPLPELFAFAGLSFALDESFSIYGGNLKSTMAGEFSFSISLSIAMLALGLLANGLRTGRYRVWTSVLLAAACVSHGVVLIAFLVPAAVVFCLIWIDRTRWRYAWTVGVTTILLSAWWVLPFLWDHEYHTDMKYGALTNWWEMYFPLTIPLDIIITTLAILGFLFSILRRDLNGSALGVLALVLVAGVYLGKDSIPGLGLLWNPRVLPGLYLVRYLLMMIGAYSLLALIWNAIRDRRANDEPSAVAATGLAVVPAVGVLVVLGFLFQELPGGGNTTLDDGTSVYSWGPFVATSTNADAQGDGWSSYNFRGYEGRGQYYTEYRQVVTTMEGLGDDPNHGCGRALWENSGDNGQYGTTMALMLLPFWTDGCIGSMEGLFFEASGTTPYHFLTAAAMSKQSSNPVRELRYTDNDASVGVRHLQDLGVRYAMVRTDEAKNEAAQQPELTLVAESAPWEIYEVANSDIVVGLDMQPVVVEERLGDGDGANDPRERLLEIGASWFQQPDEWVAMPAEGGPDSWQRIDVEPDLTRRLEEGDPNGPRVDIVVPAEPIEPVPLPAVTVSNVEMYEQSLEFDVDQVGVPVLVKVSYFPNWQADGAEGPWRIGPNMMVVVPTDTHVELSYGRSAADYLSILLTLFGIALCFWWRREGDVVHGAPVPAGFGKPTDADGDDGDIDDELTDGSTGHAPRDEWSTDRRTEVELVPSGAPDDSSAPADDEPPLA